MKDVFTLMIPVVAAAGSATTDYSVISSQLSGASSNAVYQMIGADFIPNATSATNGTNYATMTLYGADGTTAQATRATSATSLTVGTVDAQSLTGGSNAGFNPGEIIKIAVAHSGSGVAVDGNMVLLFRKLA